LALEGFTAEKDGPTRAGLHPRNLCNRGRQARGLQLELSEGLRGRLFRSLDRRGRQHPTPAFHQLARSLRAALDEYIAQMAE
jgi:phage replication-related protein YjqB (UPF0714/DUF867 family)